MAANGIHLADDPELIDLLHYPRTAFVQKPIAIDELADVTRSLLK